MTNEMTVIGVAGVNKVVYLVNKDNIDFISQFESFLSENKISNKYHLNSEATDKPNVYTFELDDYDDTTSSGLTNKFIFWLKKSGWSEIIIPVFEIKRI